MTDERQIVWEADLDDKYHCEVRRTGDYTGELIMREGDTELLKQNVGLAYRAIFGPDVSDVAEWQTICLAKADELAKQ